MIKSEFIEISYKPCKFNDLSYYKALAFDLHISLAEPRGKSNFMRSSAIKVIKKSSQTIEPVSTETKNVKNFSKKVAIKIEDNIKGWIQELEVRKNDELVQAYSLLG